MSTRYLNVETLNARAVVRVAAPDRRREGQSRFYQRFAFILHARPTEAAVEVLGRDGRNVVRVARTGAVTRYACDCGGSFPDLDPCSHVIAAALALEQHLRLHPPATWRTQIASVVSGAPASQPPVAYGLAFTLYREGDAWTLIPWRVRMDQGAEDPVAAAKAAISGGAKAEQWTAATSGWNVQAHTEHLAAAVVAASANPHGWSYSPPSDHQLGLALRILPGAPVYLGDLSRPFQRELTIEARPRRLVVRLDRSDQDLLLVAMLDDGGGGSPVSLSEARFVCLRPPWVLIGDRLAQVEGAARALTALASQPLIEVPADEVEEFLDSYLLPLAETTPVLGEGLTIQDVDAEPEPRLYLTDSGGVLRAHLRFGYGPAELAFTRRAPEVSVARLGAGLELARVKRRPDIEAAAEKEAITGHGLKRGQSPGVLELRVSTHPVDFLAIHVPDLVAAGFTIYGEDRLSVARVSCRTPRLQMAVSSGIDWFDVHAEVLFGEQRVPLKRVAAAARKKERFIKLADGTLGELPEGWFDRYRRLLGLAEPTDEGLRLRPYHAHLLDEVMADSDRGAADEQFRDRLEQLRDFRGIEERSAPRGLAGELRPYQLAGFRWLHFLHDYGFGGVLADDMGIGKTVQMLAFLLSHRESGHARAADLVVAPRSLLFNWEREARRFAPSLRVLVHSDQDRHRTAREFDDYDLVLTTYGIVLRDIGVLKKYRFHCAVLDESQVVKNPASLTSRAVRSLVAEHRFALTGTPVENSTMDLWAQFAFASPGLLGSLETFREEYATPIERSQDGEAAASLRRLVHPFLLRRTKEQVAAELPPRTERLLLTDMEPEQREVYERTRDTYRAMLLRLIDAEGVSNARMRVLEGLLRLRQIANHPRLAERGYTGPSGKCSLLFETLETLAAEGHKALVFSQFVQMLKIVRAGLEARGITYQYLDGQTADRQTRVDAFQRDPSVPFFLISLKAGGLGLNLTAADYVVHVDPWWNPAVETQAADRTHRIGQERPVFIYKLITRDTVEEKILELQERKRRLVEQVVSTERGFLKSLTREDIESLFA